MFKQRVRVKREPRFQPFPKHNAGRGAVGTLANPTKALKRVPTIPGSPAKEKPVNLAMQPGVSANSVMTDDDGDQLPNALPEPGLAVQKRKGSAQPSESNAMLRGKAPKTPKSPPLKGSRRNPLFGMF